MIVLMHTSAIHKYVDTSSAEWTVFGACVGILTNLAMPAFFILSGYLLFKGLSRDSFGRKITSRIRRYLVPFLAWNLFFLAVYLLASPISPHLSQRVVQFRLMTLSGALGKIFTLNELPIDGPLWFIRDLFIYAIVSLPILFVIQRVNWRIIAIVVVLWCAVDGFLESRNVFVVSTIDSWHVASYLVGAMLACRGKDLLAFFRPLRYVVVGSLAMLLFMWLKLPYFTDYTHRFSLWELVAFKYCVVLYGPVIYGIIARLPCSHIAETAFFKWFNKMAFFAYAGHFLFCSILMHLFAERYVAVARGHGGVVILSVIFFGGGMALMSCIYGFLLKFFPRTVRLFDGTL